MVSDRLVCLVSIVWMCKKQMIPFFYIIAYLNRIDILWIVLNHIHISDHIENIAIIDLMLCFLSWEADWSAICESWSLSPDTAAVHQKFKYYMLLPKQTCFHIYISYLWYILYILYMLYLYIYINMTYRLSMGLSVCPILTAPAKPAALQGAATGALRRCWVHLVRCNVALGCVATTK